MIHLWVFLIHNPLAINNMAITIQVTAIKPFAPSLEFVTSSANTDCSGQSKFSFDIKLDVWAYTKNYKRGATDVARAEIIMEFKWHQSDDPFCEPYPLPGDLNRSTFLRDNKSGRDTLGQITSCGGSARLSIPHTHLFSS